MTEQTLSQENTAKAGMGSIIRKIAIWAVFGLLLLTVIMAAYQRFS